jgi:hypothetical protein
MVWDNDIHAIAMVTKISDEHSVSMFIGVITLVYCDSAVFRKILCMCMNFAQYVGHCHGDKGI